MGHGEFIEVLLEDMQFMHVEKVYVACLVLDFLRCGTTCCPVWIQIPHEDEQTSKDLW